MAAFVSSAGLQIGSGGSCAGNTTTCKARGSSRKRSSRRAKASRGPLSGGSGAVPGNLTDEFEEDVKERLVPGKRKSEKEEKVGAVRRLLEEFDVRKITWGQGLDLLVKGSWIGIGIMVGYFLVVHFVIVKDFLPH